MNINRTWAMPNSNTFDILPIKQLIGRYYHKNSIDPFANKNRIATVTNDIDEAYDCNFNMDAIDFLKTFDDSSIDLVLYDPPYSPRQVAECYKRVGRTVNMETTQSSYWAMQKAQISRICNGTVISFGWNSGGIGMKYGFKIIEILLVPHGGAHNDTICVVEQKKISG